MQRLGSAPTVGGVSCYRRVWVSSRTPAADAAACAGRLGCFNGAVILVTGATGQVGYRIMEALADAGADAAAMVRVEAYADHLPGSGQPTLGTPDGPSPAEVLR